MATAPGTPKAARPVVGKPATVIRAGALRPLLTDGSVTEIMVNGPGQVYFEQGGALHLSPITLTEDELEIFVQDICTYTRRQVSASEPLLDGRLPEGSRVNIVCDPIVRDGPVVTIRRFPIEGLTAEQLVESGAATTEAFDFLQACVLARRNILVSGGTGSGKTTLLNILSGWIPSSERIISIEDAAELRLRHPHWVSMEARPIGGSDREITTRELLRNSLRQRPDRIIVGEVRGAEAMDMLQAMNTGHDGSMSTIHANTARDALNRLETLLLMGGFDLPARAIGDQISRAIHVIVQVERAGTRRRIAQITEVVGKEGVAISIQDIFTLTEARDPQAQRLERTMVPPKAVAHMTAVRDQVAPWLARIIPR